MSRSNVHTYAVDGKPHEAFLQCVGCNAEWGIDLTNVPEAARAREIEASIDRHLAWCDRRSMLSAEAG